MTVNLYFLLVVSSLMPPLPCFLPALSLHSESLLYFYSYFSSFQQKEQGGGAGEVIKLVSEAFS